ncbi:hypothetical protein GCM10009560_62560 [Nonomuraea longicatena]|uniref:Uncharacterized protein n=1 Tax=Nonomuraea longicatena TaxID=83682 RepID=A0ABP4BBE5_9ACTN
MSGLDLSVVPAQRLGSQEPVEPQKGRCGEDDCPTPPSARAYRVEWAFEGNMWVRRFGRLPRVARVSCRCRPVEFELLALGGLYWIRRFERTGDGLVVRVSPQAANRWVGELWSLIMSGEAW